jgi:hypothetical protein
VSHPVAHHYTPPNRCARHTRCASPRPTCSLQHRLAEPAGGDRSCRTQPQAITPRPTGAPVTRPVRPHGGGCDGGGDSRRDHAHADGHISSGSSHPVVSHHAPGSRCASHRCRRQHARDLTPIAARSTAAHRLHPTRAPPRRRGRRRRSGRCRRPPSTRSLDHRPSRSAASGCTAADPRVTSHPAQQLHRPDTMRLTTEGVTEHLPPTPPQPDNDDAPASEEEDDGCDHASVRVVASR